MTRQSRLVTALRWVIRRLCTATGHGEVVYRALGAPDGFQWAEWLRMKGARIGEGTTINHRAIVYHGDEWRLHIGRDCSISCAEFVTHSGFDRVLSKLAGRTIDTSRFIFIGDRCFIGSGAQLGPGVSIGDDCIIGFGAVVRESVPAGSIVYGNPAKVVGRTQDYIDRALGRVARRAA